MNLKITGGTPLTGEITPTGSKNSIMALLPATLLFDKPLTLTNVPDITDVSRLVDILTQLGSKITWNKAAKDMTVDNSAVTYAPLKKGVLGTSKGIKGTSLLWGPMLARFGKTEVEELPGGCTLGARPVDAHYQAFEDLGVTVAQTEEGVVLDAAAAKPGPIWLIETSVTATENAIMLATHLAGTTKIFNAACEPHVQDLCNFLNKAGAAISGIGSNSLTIDGGKPLSPVNYEIISDHYEIATFLALGAITSGQIKVHKALPEYFVGITRDFCKFGIDVKYEGDTAIIAKAQAINIGKTKSAVVLKAQPWPGLPVDVLPLFIPIALAAPSGQTLLHNWMYESGLFWTSELNKLGANVIMCDPHRILVTAGNKLKGATLEAPYIIRAVIAMTMAALISEGETIILNADAIHRGHPNFIANLKSLGAKIEEF